MKDIVVAALQVSREAQYQERYNPFGNAFLISRQTMQQLFKALEELRKEDGLEGREGEGGG